MNTNGISTFTLFFTMLRSTVPPKEQCPKFFVKPGLKVMSRSAASSYEITNMGAILSGKNLKNFEKLLEKQFV